MAILDRRLIPFIEMLTDLGLDWLAFELFDGIRRGREPEESAEALMLAREHVRTGEVKIVKREPAVDSDTEPLLGDEQLEWAARYIDDRFKATLAEISASLDNIDEIVRPARDKEAGYARPAATMLVLRNGEENRNVDRAQVEEAQSQLPKLQEALASWLASMRTDLAQ